MDCSVLARCSLFKGIPEYEVEKIIGETEHEIRTYSKDETIVHAMESAVMIGIILEGFAEAQKTFPNGNQVNVSLRSPGDLIGPAAVFSSGQVYPCDIVAVEPVTLLILKREELLALMQRNVHILENFMTGLASTTYMLQQRLELMSYSGIAQKITFYLLMQTRRGGRSSVIIPESVSKWALMMNVSRTSLHREIRRLESEGMIAYRPPVIEIIDRKRLQGVLGE